MLQDHMRRLFNIASYIALLADLLEMTVGVWSLQFPAAQGTS